MASQRAAWSEVGKRVERIGAAVDRGAKAAQAAVIAEIVDEAKARSPVESGELRDSIAATEDGVEVTAPHSSLIEFGSDEGRVKAQPFLRPAVASVLPRVRGITVDEVAREVAAQVARERGSKP